jgi:hypothetical protein
LALDKAFSFQIVFALNPVAGQLAPVWNFSTFSKRVSLVFVELDKITDPKSTEKVQYIIQKSSALLLALLQHCYNH